MATTTACANGPRQIAQFAIGCYGSGRLERSCGTSGGRESQSLEVSQCRPKFAWDRPGRREELDIGVVEDFEVGGIDPAVLVALLDKAPVGGGAEADAALDPDGRVRRELAGLLRMRRENVVRAGENVLVLFTGARRNEEG